MKFQIRVGIGQSHMFSHTQI
uniref:Uncharacterized protein n=1 Tax=Anguilla anguilla TaxID=7936 RepID=A0A0E9TB35_ANGAN